MPAIQDALDPRLTHVVLGQPCAADAAALKRAIASDLQALIHCRRLAEGCDVRGEALLGGYRRADAGSADSAGSAELELQKGGFAMASALASPAALGVRLVSESWLVECCRVRALVPDEAYRISLEGFLGED